MKLEEIHIRDPFILPADGRYYLYGTRGSSSYGIGRGLDVYVSDDLMDWSEPHEAFTRPADFWADRDFWAPEVHAFGGKYYMFASFKAEGKCRGTQILCADSPMGPFLPITKEPVTPRDWECLDGTLYVSPAGRPYLIFCHEWLQIKDGAMCAVELTPDLRERAGEVRTLFHASEPAWVNKAGENFVTDGPYPVRLSDGKLLLLWSSFAADGRYVEAMAVSDNGDITGHFHHLAEPLLPGDGGHGMVFRTYDGKMMFVMHTPNVGPKERPCLIEVEEKDGRLVAKI